MEEFELLISEGKGEEFLAKLLKLIDLEDKEVKEKYDELCYQWKNNQRSKEFGYLDEQQSIYSFQSVYKRNENWIKNNIIPPISTKEEVIQPIIPVQRKNRNSNNVLILRRKNYIGILSVFGGLLLLAPFFYHSATVKFSLVGNTIVSYQPNIISYLWDGGRLVCGIVTIINGIWSLIVPYGQINEGNFLEVNDIFKNKKIPLSSITKVKNQLYITRKRKKKLKFKLKQINNDDVKKLKNLFSHLD